MSYCTPADVVPFLPSGGLPAAPRTGTASASGDYIEHDGHGLADGAEVLFRAPPGAELPGGLIEGPTYYAIVVSPSRFQVAATEGGPAIDITSAGENFVWWSPLPWQSWIDWAAREIDSFLPAHVVPLVAPYPQVVVTANAELAAAKGLAVTGGAEIDLGARIDQIAQRLARWAKGLPVRGVAQSRTAPATLAITSSSGAADPRGWAPRGNGVLP